MAGSCGTGQLGVTWTPAGITTPIILYGGGGFAQGGVRVVIWEDEHELMSKTLSGYILRACADMYSSPVFSIGASYSFSQFRGTIDNDPVKAQINMVLVNGTYHIPAH